MATKQVGPFTVDDEREFTLSDLRKVGRWNHDGKVVFVDYSGTGKYWYVHSRADGATVDYTDYPAKELTKTRRSVLKAMVTRRDNKRRREARKAASV